MNEFTEKGEAINTVFEKLEQLRLHMNNTFDEQNFKIDLRVKVDDFRQNMAMLNELFEVKFSQVDRT